MAFTLVFLRKLLGLWKTSGMTSPETVAYQKCWEKGRKAEIKTQEIIYMKNRLTLQKLAILLPILGKAGSRRGKITPRLRSG